MQENYHMYIWGRGYPAARELKKNVTTLSVGENHIIYITNSKEVYGLGSNKFGQLGLPENITYAEPQRLFEQELPIGGSNIKLNIKSVHCGAEHTFLITQKNQVYSLGLNIKGQLGQGHFQNIGKPSLVVSLLPQGKKNPKSLNPAFQKGPKPPIVEILEKFDLQVKMEDEPIESVLLMNDDQFIADIKCGALFTLALTNKGRVFACGYQGTAIQNSDDFMDKAKFKHIALDHKIVQISSGLSGAGVLTKEGLAYVWGRFGKSIHNVPKKVSKLQAISVDSQESDRYCEIRVGDEFVAVLSMKGEVYTFGQNIENQLGCDSETIALKVNLQKVTGIPLVKSIYVGRNHCFAISGDNEIYGWGSNRYNQIGQSDSYPIIMKPKNLGIKLPEGGKLFPSSYFTLALSPEKINFSASVPDKMLSSKAEETISLSEYKKLLHDYQVLKSLNLALLEKNQQPKKQSYGVQTLSKFEIDGVTKYRQFDSNLQIEWSELDIIERLNEGGYGVIFKAKWRQIVVVVKKFKIDNGDVSLRDFLSECNAMEAVRHPHIVMFLGAVVKPKNYSIILEHCACGSLWGYLQNHENAISWDERKRFAIQIAQAVLYLHECKPAILHRDLKSLNIFLDEHLRIKIGDFGWTKTLDEYMTNKIGTYQWMAPEVIGNKPYTEKADVFSYSIILWEIASREPPYRNITGAKVSQAVLYNQMRPQPYAKLMKRCWETNPDRRPNFRDIIRQLEIMKLP